MDTTYPIEGGCGCRQLRYQLKKKPMFVHACHCRFCQRESGSAFVINAIIEADEVVSLTVKPLEVYTPSASGAGQLIYRCPRCFVAVWSVYNGSSPAILYVRAGTLDDPDILPPKLHIYTSTKQPWVQLTDLPTSTEFYDMDKMFSEDGRARRAALVPRIIEYRKKAEEAKVELEKKSKYEEERKGGEITQTLAALQIE